MQTASGLGWWNWWDTGAGATVAEEPKPGSATGTEVPNFHRNFRGLFAAWHIPNLRSKQVEALKRASDLRFLSERATGLEPATLTLASAAGYHTTWTFSPFTWSKVRTEQHTLSIIAGF